MRICFIGKFPPIEGGVSRDNYWTAFRLAKAGHAVYVVTNAEEVEDEYRITLDAEDASWLEPRFEPGFVRVFSTTIPEEKLAYIPTANPFVTKVASLATQVIREFDCDLVIASYFEPYVVAGYLASRFTGKPIVAKHAGSDLGRLMREPELATTYKEVLKSVDGVLTSARHRERFIAMGVEPHRVLAEPPFPVPAYAFNADAVPLSHKSPPFGKAVRIDGTFAPLEPSSRFRIGIYGKIGWAKGSFDLVSALGRLVDSEDFELLAMTNGHPELMRRFEQAVQTNHLGDRTFMLPFLPNWRVPEFIRSCGAVCFLERDFPIVFHGPIVAREVLACGTPLILSREIANKQRFGSRLYSGVNVWIVEDPKDHAELADVVRQAMREPSGTNIVGMRGLELLREFESEQAAIDAWEAVLHSVTRSPRVEPPDETALRMRLSGALPVVSAILGADFEVAIRGFEYEAPSFAGLTLPAAFVEYLSAKADLLAKHDGLEDVLRYTRLSLRMKTDPPAGHSFTFVSPDRVRSRLLDGEGIDQMRPLLSRSAEVHAFPSAVLAMIKRGTNGVKVDPSDMRFVLFNRSQNLEPCEIEINGATRSLLERCNGTATTAQLVDDMARSVPNGDAEAIRGSVVSTLGRLRAAGVLVFT